MTAVDGPRPAGLAALAAALADADPDRFGQVMAAVPADRPALLTLYALNAEVARAPLLAAEPLLAEMRLQWWIDRLAAMGQGAPPPAHDLLTPLWDAWGRDAAALVPLAEARRRDAARVPHPDPDSVVAYVEATAGALMAAAATRLGAPAAAAGIIADQARGAGLAAWLRALPALQPLGLGLAAPGQAATTALATLALAALTRARAGRRAIPRRAAPALFAGTDARALLTALAGGGAMERRPDPAPFTRRLALARLALTGRWWT